VDKEALDVVDEVEAEADEGEEESDGEGEITCSAQTIPRSVWRA